MSADREKLWAEALLALARLGRARAGRDELWPSPEAVSTWLAGAELVSCRDGRAVVRARDAAHARALRQRYAGALAEALGTVVGSRVEVEFLVEGAGAGAGQLQPEWGVERPLNPAFTLEGFAEGDCNRLALAAVRGALDRPGTLYNPLYVHGPPGTGKTHLLQAACREAGRWGRAAYLPAEELAARLAAPRAESEGFRRALRSLDFLAMDDVQVLAGRESSQEEVFHAFNALYNGNRQILAAGDRHPRELGALPGRLVTRLSWGLVAALEPPRFEARLKILSMKAARLGAALASRDLEALAARPVADVRELEGLLLQTAASPGTPAEARPRPARPAAPARRQELSTEEVQRQVAAAFGLRSGELLGASRSRSVARARHVAIYLARELTGMPLQEIAGHFGGRDRATISYAVRKVARLVADDPATAALVERLRRQLSGVKPVQ